MSCRASAVIAIGCARHVYYFETRGEGGASAPEDLGVAALRSLRLKRLASLRTRMKFISTNFCLLHSSCLLLVSLLNSIEFWTN